MESYSEVPIGIGLIVCDTIIEDKLTSKKSLIGIFSQIHAAKLPCLFNSMSILVSLTGGSGDFPCDIICQHASGEATVFKLSCNLHCKSPMQVMDLVFQLKHIRFPLPGHYWIKVVVDDIPVMMRPLSVIPKPPAGDAPPLGKPGEAPPPSPQDTPSPEA